MRKYHLILFLIFFLAGLSGIDAASRYWIATTSVTWNNSANWSTSSGGGGGASVPGSSDLAIFDGTGGANGNCTIDAVVNVAGFSISGYIGTISQGANTITIGTSNFSMSSGTFTGGTSAITINGLFTLSGGAFTSTSATLSIGGSLGSSTVFTHSAGTFTHNSGTVNFNPNGGGCIQYAFTFDVIPSTSFYNVIFNVPNACGIAGGLILTAAGDTIDVTNNLTHTDGYINGLIEVKGNFSVGSATDGGTGQIIIDGTGTQSYIVAAGNTRTCNVIVNKTAGAVIPDVTTTNFSVQGFSLLQGSFTAPTGTFYVGGNISSSSTIFTHTAGTFTHNNGTISFDSYGNACAQITFNIDVATTTAFYDVIFNGANYCGIAGAIFTTSAGDTVDATHNLTHTDGYINGMVEVKGNLSIGTSSDGGIGKIIFDGTGAQSYIVAAGSTRTCNVVVNKTAGAVTPDVTSTNFSVQGFSLLQGAFTAPTGNFSIGGSISTSSTIFNHAAGTFTHNNGTTIFDPYGSACAQITFNIDVATTTTFYDVVFNAPNYCGIAGAIITSSAGDTIEATRNLTHTDGYINALCEVKGNFSVGTASDGGTGKVIFDGTGAQSYIIAAGTTRTCHVVVNKSAGAVTPDVSTTDFSVQAFTLLQGAFTAPTGTFYVGGAISTSSTIFTHSAGTFTHNNGTTCFDPYGSACAQITFNVDVITATSFYNVTLNAPNYCGIAGAIFTTSAGDTIDAMHNFTHTDGYINGLIEVKGDLSVGSSSDGGTGKIIFDATVAQSYIITGGATRTCNIVVNKTAGAVTPDASTTDFYVQGFTLLQGAFTAPTGTFYIGGSISSSATIFIHSAGTFTHNSGTVSFDPYGNICAQATFTLDVITTTSFYNVTFNGTNYCGIPGAIFAMLAGDTIEVTRNLLFKEGYFNGIIECRNNVTVNSTFDGGTGTLIFDGTSGNQNFDLTGATNLYDGPIKVNKTSGNVILQSILLMDGAAQTLTLTKGNVISTATNMLQIGDNVTVSGASDASYVDGPCRKIGNDAFTFPVGKGGYYRLCGISAPGSTTDHFTAEYFSADPNTSYDITNKAVILQRISRCEYWIIDRTNGSSNVNVTLSWNHPSTPTCNITVISELLVARWGAPTWQNHGNGGTTGNASAGTIVTSAVVTSFSPFTLASSTANNPLPIQLLDFNAVKNGNRVDLQWNTATETNNDYFTVERSKDIVTFEPLVMVKGAGNSTSALHYKAMDELPFSGTSYYRLKQTDFDGKFSYSNIAAVNFDTAIPFDVFPNPSDGSNLNINIQSENTEPIFIVIYDTQGRETFSKVIVVGNTTGNISLIDSSQKLAAGIYIIAASSNSNIVRKKIIVK
jgi:hypothetical protein